MGGIGFWQLLIVFVIVVLLFGTKKLRTLGGDLGTAIKGFKKAVADTDSKDADFQKVETIESQSAASERQLKEREQQK